jgi:malonyl CoA-acyl carrier protein transacylase
VCQVRLAVAGAFHTDYMKPAVERLREVLATIDVSPLSHPTTSCNQKVMGWDRRFRDALSTAACTA